MKIKGFCTYTSCVILNNAIAQVYQRVGAKIFKFKYYSISHNGNIYIGIDAYTVPTYLCPRIGETTLVKDEKLSILILS
jgi:hypothetical protein